MAPIDEYLVITAADLRHHRVPVRQGWEFAPQRFKWLAGHLWKLLLKVNAVKPHFGSFDTWKIRTRERNNKPLLEAIYEVIGPYAGELDRYVLLMGRLDYVELVRTDLQGMGPAPGGVFSFHAEPFGYRGKLFDVNVHVVDTLKGFALVPRIVVETRHG